VAAGGALTILLSALIFIAVNTIYAWGLLAANRQKKCVMIISVQVAVNLLLNLFLIPAYGILGAALATVCAEIVGLPLYFFEFRKIVPTALVRNLVRPFAGGVGMLAFLRVFSCQNLWVLIAGAAFCYVIILWITGAFRLKELKFIYDSLVQHRRPPGLFELEEEKF
jgi:O-antigen/teichoic acid export membrane protein